jgi:hypothetical protein
MSKFAAWFQTRGNTIPVPSNPKIRLNVAGDIDTRQHRIGVGSPRLRPGTREISDTLPVILREHGVYDVFVLDDEQFSTMNMRPEEYATLFRVFHRIVKDTVSTARISPGFDVFGEEQSLLFDEFFKLINDSKIRVDEWRFTQSFHPTADHPTWEDSIDVWKRVVMSASAWSKDRGSPMVLSTFYDDTAYPQAGPFNVNLLEDMLKFLYDDRNIVEALWFGFNDVSLLTRRTGTGPDDYDFNDLGNTFKRESDRYDTNLYVITSDDMLHGGLLNGIYLYDYYPRNSGGWPGQVAVTGVGIAEHRYLFKSDNDRIYATHLSHRDGGTLPQNGWYSFNQLSQVSNVTGPLTALAIHKDHLLVLSRGGIDAYVITRNAPPTLSYSVRVTRDDPSDPDPDHHDWYNIEYIAAVDGFMYSIFQNKLYGHDISTRDGQMFIGRGFLIDKHLNWGPLAGSQGYLYVAVEGNLFAHAVNRYILGDRILVKHGGFTNVKTMTATAVWADS